MGIFGQTISMNCLALDELNVALFLRNTLAIYECSTGAFCEPAGARLMQLVAQSVLVELTETHYKYQ